MRFFNKAASIPIFVVADFSHPNLVFVRYCEFLKIGCVDPPKVIFVLSKLLAELYGSISAEPLIPHERRNLRLFNQPLEKSINDSSEILHAPDRVGKVSQRFVLYKTDEPSWRRAAESIYFPE